MFFRSRLIGYYLPVSIFDQYLPPDNVELTTSPLLQFQLRASSRVDPPSLATLSAAQAVIQSSFGLSSSDLYASFSYQSTRNASAYDLNIYFTSNAAATAFNLRSIATNSSFTDFLAEVIANSTANSYNASLASSSSLSIDPSWLYVTFKLTPTTSARKTAPTKAESNAIRSVAATVWGVSASSLFTQSRSASDGVGYEFSFYFRTALSQQIFMLSKIPVNESLPAIGSLISSATSNEFSAAFLRSSAYQSPSQQIDVSWPWVQFLLVSTNGSTDGPSFSMTSTIQSRIGGLIGLNGTDIVLFIRPLSSSRKRASVSFDMKIFFSSSTSQASFSAIDVPTNRSFSDSINAIVSDASQGAYNSTYVGDSVSSSPTLSGIAVPSPLSLGIILAIAIPCAVVAVVIIVVIVVLFRRRMQQLKRIEKNVEKLPEELKAVLSIKSGEIVLGNKLGEGSVRPPPAICFFFCSRSLTVRVQVRCCFQGYLARKEGCRKAACRKYAAVAHFGVFPRSQSYAWYSPASKRCSCSWNVPRARQFQSRYGVLRRRFYGHPH